jgi:hypothetical protein
MSVATTTWPLTLDRVYADRTAALSLEIDDPGAGWWEARGAILSTQPVISTGSSPSSVPTAISGCAAPQTSQSCDCWASSPGRWGGPPRDLGGPDPWKDAESCLHSGSTPMSCANAR